MCARSTAPYDPQGYATSWIRGNGGEGHHQAFTNFDGDASRDELYGLIEQVLKQNDRKLRREQWEEIHKYYHDQAVMLPLWGKRIPALINSRLTNYEAGHQQFDYPVHRLIPADNDKKEVTIAPGAQTGLFTTVGRLDPHTYRPNEFFANNWVYEGLVQHGEEGQFLPALAESWTIEDDPATGLDKVTFRLRRNVTFHDGADFNCAAAKLNFDHVLAGDLKTEAWHGWYGVPRVIEDVACESEFVLILTTQKYYPLLQELSYIRPLRMLSPAAFAGDADPITANSCHVGWGTIESTEFDDVTCVGITNVSGTGPFVLASRQDRTDAEGNTIDDEVVFQANPRYWDQPPAYDTLRVVRYDTAEAVRAALEDGSLDVVWGAGVLSDATIAELQDDDDLASRINIFYSDDIQNVVLLLNSGQPPLDDIEVRKIIIHAINKPAIVEQEQVGEVVHNVFPLHAPDCDVALTPRWDYDLEKSTLLSCGSEDSDNKALAIGLGVGLGLPLLVLLIAALHYFNKSKQYEAQLLKNAKAEST